MTKWLLYAGAGMIFAALLLLTLRQVFSTQPSAPTKPAGPPKPTAKPSQPSANTSLLKANNLLSQIPIFDGNNDMAKRLKADCSNDLEAAKCNLRSDLKDDDGNRLTNIALLKKGHVGAQFWVAFADCSLQLADAVRVALEQIDVIHRVADMYSDSLRIAYSASDVEDIRSGGRVASLIAVEGGHSLDSSLGTLRAFYMLGVRSLGIANLCRTPWSSSSDSSPGVAGDKLSPFGKNVVLEMNRLGMLVDLTHSSREVMRQVLRLSKAPVMFSHSNVAKLCGVPRNVPDDVLDLLKQNDGIFMVSFLGSTASCKSPGTLSEVVDNFDYVKKRIGVRHLGIGSSLEGDVPSGYPEDLRDASHFPHLVAELLHRGWTDQEVKQVVALNMLRVFSDAEQVAARLQREDFAPRDAVVTSRAEVRAGVAAKVRGRVDTCRRGFYPTLASAP